MRPSFFLMLRFIVILLASILLISVMRSIIGIIMRGFGDLMKSETGAPRSAPAAARKEEVPAGGELKKDPVCGTFVPVTTAMKKIAGGSTVYFCSAECRDKYRG